MGRGGRPALTLHSAWKIKPDALAEVQAQLASAPVHRNTDVSSLFLRGRPSIA